MLHSDSFNPWLSMWTQPRSTIRAIVHENPKYRIFLIGMLWALQTLFYYANYWSLGIYYESIKIVAASFLIAPFAGWIWVCYYGWVLRVVGRGLDGYAPTRYLRAAVAWSYVPCVFNLLLWFVLFVDNQEYVFIQSAIGPSAIFIVLINAILGGWSFVLLVQSVSEVQNFSLNRSITNVLIAGIVSYLTFFMLILVFNYLFKSLLF